MVKVLFTLLLVKLTLPRPNVPAVIASRVELCSNLKEHLVPPAHGFVNDQNM